MDHRFSCAVLTVAEGILNSGLEDYLNGTINESNRRDARFVNSIFVKLVLTMHSDIFKSIKDIVDNNKCEKNPISCFKSNSQIMNSENENKTSFNCYKTNNSFGRTFKSTKSMLRGEVIQSFPPFTVTVCSRCGCNSGNLLNEHITMADLIFSNDNDMSNEVLKLFSGWEEGHQWSNRMKYLITLISTISVLIFLLHKTKEMLFLELNDKDFLEYIKDNITLISNEELTKASFKHQQILCRLPANIHGISRIVSKNKLTVELTQEQIGYGLFLEAAKFINHSCQPNACNRFVFNKRNSRIADAKVKGDSELKLLSECFLEVVAIDEIKQNDEIFISYGPTKSTMVKVERQKILNEQYLFNCECSGCLTNLEENDEMINDEKENLNDKHMKNIKMEIVNFMNNFETIKGDFSNSSNDKNIKEINEKLENLINRLIQFEENHFQHIINNNMNLTGKEENNIFKRFSYFFCEVLDFRGHIEASLGFFNSAALLVEKAINRLSLIGHLNKGDVSLGREKVKLSQLLISSLINERAKLSHETEIKLSTKCCGLVKEALNDLEPFVGKNDPDWEETIGMLGFLRNNYGFP